MCGVECLISFVMFSFSHVTCQFYFAFASLALRFLLCIYFLPSKFNFMSAPASGIDPDAGVRGGASRSAGRSRVTCGYDPPFPVSDFFCKYDVYLQS